jgi:FtsZ-binding cell division protein ZapB
VPGYGGYMCDHEFIATPQSWTGSYMCKHCEMDISEEAYNHIALLQHKIEELKRDKDAMFRKYYQQLKIVDAILDHDTYALDENFQNIENIYYGQCARIIKKMQLEI